MKAPARAHLSGLLCAIFIALVAVFFSDLLRNLPQPVLAAIVLMAVAGLLKVNELRHLWQVHRNEFLLVAMVALLGVLWAGLLKGVLIGAIISLVMLIRRVSSPNIDMAGARMFLVLHAGLSKRGIAFGLVEARSAVRDMLRIEGVEKKAGRIDRFTTLADAIEDFQTGAARGPAPKS